MANTSAGILKHGPAASDFLRAVNHKQTYLYMTFDEMTAHRAKLDALGLMYRVDIAVFGETDAEHRYSFTMIY